ncbi:MAG TPA: hypothetical protein VFO00_07215 [Vitreimonas sp.]|nr:hypothetical protein [Vitreimonas sp.]
MLNLKFGRRLLAVSALWLCGAIGAGVAFAQVTQQPLPNITRAPVVQANPRTEAANRPAIMNCVGPLTVRVMQVSPDRHAQGTDIEADFMPAASATDIRPGQCWRTGGWANGLLMDPGGRGVIRYRALLGNCPLVSSMRTANGAVAEIISNDRINGQVLLNAGIRAGRFSIETTYVGRPDGNSSSPTGYLAVTAAGAMVRPGWCE